MKEYLYYPHGFMNLISMVDKSYSKGADQVKSYINKIFIAEGK
jgi:hypothetical protein